MSGRSPYATRARRRQLDSQAMMMMVVDDSDGVGGGSSTSPRHSMGSSVSTGTSVSTFRLGQSLLQARLSLSPRPSLALTPISTSNDNTNSNQGTNQIHAKSFFASTNNTSNTSSNSNNDRREPMDNFMNTASTDAASTTAPTNSFSASTETSPSDLRDGIDLSQLRQLTHNCLRSSSSMGSFYASILYSKTQEPQDAVLYARSLLTMGGQRQSQAKRVVRLLEQGGLFAHTNTSVPKALRLEAILLATQALAELQEWTALLTLVEDPHLYASLLLPDDRSQTTRTTATATNSNSRKNALMASQPIDDDDSVAWQALANVLPLNPTEIHPLAQLLNHRAQAYAETGHPLRAATFFQLALKTDPKCFASLDGLLQDNPLLSATQVLDLVQGLERRPPAWLQDLYLARIHVAAPTIGIPLTNIPTNATTNDDRGTHLLDTTSATHTTLPHPDKNHGDSFWKDASSLEFLTPIERAGAESSSMMDNALIGGIGGSHADSSALDRLLDEYKLRQSPDVLAMAAQRAFRLGELNQALRYCLRLTQLDPLCTTAAYVQVATLVALGHKRALFRLAHEWVEASPQSAASWFAVGSYYYACGRFHVAQRHFCRATRLDPQVVAAWMAFGCSFAAVEESDQALASFRAAQRLAPGDATSLLYIGMEYLRTNHTSLAQHFLTASHQIHASALVQNELGVYCLREKYFDQAASWFVKALSGQPDDWQAHLSSASSTRLVTLLERVTDPYWEPTVFNLAYALRKMRRFDAALACLERSCTLCPDHASAWSARGFVCHLDGELDQAIDFYHQALACKPKDPFSSEMLQRALTDALSQTSELLQNIGLEGNRTNHHQFEEDINAPLVRRDKVRLATSASSKGRPRESINSMAMSDDGLSISVESMGDVDMG